MTTTTSSSPSRSKNSLQPDRAQAGFAFAILLTINVLNYADRSVLSAVLPKIQTEFQLNNTELGLLASSFLFIYAIATLPLGVWADRSPRKNIVALCVGLWSVATALGGLTRNFIQLFLTRSVLGIGEAGYAPASLSLLGDYFPKEQRGRILSYWSVGNLIGTALGLIIGGIIADRLGWRWAFYAVGIPGLIAAFLIWRATEPQRGAFDREGDAETGAELSHGGLGKNFWEVVKQLFYIPTYWILLAAFVFSFFTIGSAQVWIPTYLVRDFQLTVSAAGAVAGGVLAGGSLVGTIAGGWLADMMQRRRPEGRMIVATAAFILGAPLTFLALSVHTLIPFIVVFIAAIVCLSLCLGPLNAVIQDVIAPQMRATAVGLVLLLAHLLGDAASPLIIGAIADKTTLGHALIVTAPLCLLLAGVICMAGLRTVARDMQAMQEGLRKQGK
ncbi:MAG TPA: MFS transporter [Ktedonobacteraceae bacterium]|nr:MFS transporter [Ktedonobacteraceae bacterium]